MTPYSSKRAAHPSSDAAALSRRTFVAAAGALLLGGLGTARAHAASYAEYVEEPVPVLVEKTYTRVTLSAVGDNLMNFPVVEAADYNAGSYGDGQYDFTPMYAGVADIVSSHDLNFIDIETILGGDYLGISGYPVFNSPSCIAGQMAEFGWNLATTATNHSLDMGYEGILNSCATWAQFPQVKVAGTYTSWEDRSTVRVIERNGIKFALLAYSDYFNGYVIPSDAPWCVAEADADAMTADVARAREVADVVIVAMSWGSENDFYPNETQRYFAQHLANLGVDLVLGFGPHVIQPIEWVAGQNADGTPSGKSTLVVFSLGNFLSNQPYSYANVEGCFTCAFERLGDTGPISIVDLVWTPLINHISNGWHQVFKLKDYTAELAWSHESIGREADPLGYCYDLTYQIIGPSGIPINWYY